MSKRGITRRSLRAIAYLSLAAAIQAFAVGPSLEAGSTSQWERMLFAAHTYSAITRHFAHWEGVPGLDFDESFEAYVRTIAGQDSRRDFDMATLKLVTGLNNGHAGFQDPWLQSHSGAAVGINVLHRNDGWIVITSQRQGIRPGDQITKIDGAPFDEFYNSLAAYIPSSSDRARRNWLSSIPYYGRNAFD